ncbi:MAG: hypothetical protein KJO63_01140 [Maribacter sp.]|nr:hypothetical protein [Maribacter sp.]
MKLIDLQQFLKQKLQATTSYTKNNETKSIGSETLNDQMFIGAAFSSDLQHIKKHNQSQINEIYKRIGITATKELDNSEKFI